MSVSSILLDPNNPSAEPEVWSDLNVKSVMAKSSNIVNISSNSILANSDITAPTIVASDTIEIAGTYFISSLESFKSHGYCNVSDQCIELHDNEAYYFTKLVDLYDASDNISYRIKCGQFNTLRGNGLETSGIMSTGLSDTLFLVETNSTITINDMKFVADGVGDQNCIKMVSSDGLSTADWRSVNFYGFGSNTGESTIVCDNYNNIILDTLGFLSSSNIDFKNTSGNFGTVAMMNCFFQPKTGGNCINIDSSFNCSRRFRIAYSAFVGLGGISINVASDATIPVNGFIMDTVNFGGFGTGINNIGFNDNRALYTNNTGDITNTANIGEYRMINNTSDTIISNTSDYYVVAGPTTPGPFNQRFTVSDTSITYFGAISQPAKVLVAGSLTSGNNNQLDIGVRKNGVLIENSVQEMTTSGSGRVENVATFGVGLISQSDVYDIVVRNKTATNNILMDRLHVLITNL